MLIRCLLHCLRHIKMGYLFCFGFLVISLKIKQKSSSLISPFQAEILVHEADDIAEGIVQVIAIHEIKNLVMGSAANSDMTYLASETANKVMQEANLSCKLWFVYNENLIFTREVNSYNVTPTPTSSTSTRSNNESTREEKMYVGSFEVILRP
ncbi:U-box domain-containing protein 36-like [Carex rostrata]